MKLTRDIIDQFTFSTIDLLMGLHNVESTAASCVGESALFTPEHAWPWIKQWVAEMLATIEKLRPMAEILPVFSAVWPAPVYPGELLAGGHMVSNYHSLVHSLAEAMGERLAPLLVDSMRDAALDIVRSEFDRFDYFKLFSIVWQEHDRAAIQVASGQLVECPGVSCEKPATESPDISPDKYSADRAQILRNIKDELKLNKRREYPLSKAEIIRKHLKTGHSFDAVEKALTRSYNKSKRPDKVRTK